MNKLNSDVKIEVPSFIKKLNDSKLNSLVGEVANGTIDLNVEVRNSEGQLIGFKKQLLQREKLILKGALLKQLVSAKKFYGKKLVPIIKNNTMELFYDDLIELSGIKTYSNIYKEDGIDSFIDTIRNIESYYDETSYEDLSKKNNLYI